jgi:hypothetical protein
MNEAFRPSFYKPDTWKHMADTGIIGNWFPTIFDYHILFKINSGRAGGRFNFYLWWVYILMLPFVLLMTLVTLKASVVMPRSFFKDNGNYKFLLSLQSDYGD